MQLTEGQKQEAQELFRKGYSASQVFRHFGAQSIGEKSEIDVEQSAFQKADTTPALKPIVNRITGFLGLDRATETFGDAIARTRLGAKLTGTDVETNRQFIAAPTGRELAGAGLQTAAVAASPAIAPVGIGAQIAAGAGLGYAFDVGKGLQSGESTQDALTPGIATGVGAVVPPALKGIGKVLAPSTAATADDLVRIATGDKLRNEAVKNVPEFDPSRVTSALKKRATGLIVPRKTTEEAMGEVLQGRSKDVAPALKALRQVDLKDVKTYAELNTRIKDSIAKLSKEVDAELAKDTTLTPLANLTTTVTSKSGIEVSTNYVETALKQLDELYQTTGDIASKADLDALIQKAQNQGLTKLEVNDLSRIYNQEFGTKAFSKVGEPLTSVNAQMYENVRKGLKSKAREGLGGATAKKLDSDISALYNTQKLVEKNVEAVNKLQQKIQDRGLLEKMGSGVSKGIDLISGGTIRGLVGGLLPRGAGYKVMNALDLEERLAKNLALIDEALKSNSDEALIKAMQQVQKTNPELLDSTPSQSTQELPK